MPPKKSPPVTYQRAHSLRHNSTEAEAKLWTYLRSHRIKAVHFRRQHVIGKFIVDFCAPRQKLIIEVDGSQHLAREHQDDDRSVYLASKGYRILRFWNNDVTNNLEVVIVEIERYLSELEKEGKLLPTSPK
jgi:very-short-patch-repair endonuclease